MAVARYWRVIGLTTYGGGDLELSALHLQDAVGRVDFSATLTCSHAPTAGTIGALQDADSATVCRFSAEQVQSPGFWLQWDFGTATAVETLNAGGGHSKSAMLECLTLQSSPDGVAWTTLYRIGAYPWPGALTLGTAPTIAPDYATLRLNCEGVVGSGTLTDTSTSALVPASLGSAVLSNTVVRYGNTSLDSGRSALAFARYATTTAFGFGTGDFTLELSVYFREFSGDGGLMDFRATNGSDTMTWFVDGTSKKLAVWRGNLLGGTGPALDAGQWYDLMLSRSSGTLRAFINGELAWTATDSTNFTTTRPLGLGGGVYSGGVGTSLAKAYFDEVRISKGLARQTSNYTPRVHAAIEFGGVGPLVLRSDAQSVSTAASAPVGLHALPPPLRVATAFNGEYDDGSADLFLPAISLSPVTIGIPFAGISDFLYAGSLSPVVLGTHGLTVGMPPASRYFPAEGLMPVQFGQASLSTHAEYAASWLAPTQLGVHGLAQGLLAEPFMPTSFGDASVASTASPATLRPVSLHSAGLGFGFPAAGARPITIGAAGATLGGLAMAPESLWPVSLGVPSSSGSGFFAHSLYPVRLGVHSLDRGNTC